MLTATISVQFYFTASIVVNQIVLGLTQTVSAFVTCERVPGYNATFYILLGIISVRWVRGVELRQTVLTVILL